MLKRMFDKFYYILYSARPNTWLRTWGEMIVAAALASHSSFNFVIFFLTFLCASPLLWSAAYILNDLTDVELDRQHSLRGKRPLSLNLINKKEAISAIIVLAISAFILGCLINVWIITLLILLSISQLLYTLPPARLKERFILDLFINGVNSYLRFLLGWFSQTAFGPIPLFPLAIFVSFKIFLFIGHRMGNRELEKRNRIKSTTATLSIKQIYNLLALFAFISFACFFVSIIYGYFPFISVVIPLFSALILYLLRNRVSFSKPIAEEESLSLRNLIYLGYFVGTNLLALFIILFSR